MIKKLLQQLIEAISELTLQNKGQLIPIPDPQKEARWIDQRTTMHMTMRSERQLFRYVKSGRLISKKIGQANVYLESSILLFLCKPEEF